MVLRTSFFSVLFLMVPLFASTEGDDERMGEIERKMNAVLNKAGIHFNGTFRSQYLHSGLAEGSGDEAVDWGKKRSESNEYTSVDFDINARPNEALTGRIIFRMHQNWQNFFSDVSNPIFTRWISIDGNVRKMFRFNVGDYRQRYSPLSLWSPDIEIDYEPEIFAAKRREAMKEVFLGNNDRVLNGVNFNLDAELVPIFNEMHVNVNAARLRLGGTNWQSGSAVADQFEDEDMDRYFIGTNIDLLLLRGLGVGGTFMSIFDYVPSYDGSEAAARIDKDTRRGMIFGGRLRPSTKMFLDTDRFLLELDLETMLSNNRDSAWYTVTPNPADSAHPDSTLKDTRVNGTALDLSVKAGMKIGDAGSIELKAGYMFNDPDYINEMAQSPTFLGQRIMNVENDFGRGGALYTTYDALYDYVFKFSPSSSNDWNKEPHRKISYLTAVLTRDEIEEALADTSTGKSFATLDPMLQLVFPYGPATPNRAGIKGDVRARFLDGAIDMGGSLASLKEVEAGENASAKTNYLQVCGGMSLDIAAWVKALNSFRVSAALRMENADNPGPVVSPETNVSKFEKNNTMLNLGLYYNFWKRFALLGGLQHIVNKSGVTWTAATDPAASTSTVTQRHWAAGLEYKVSETSVLTGRFGQIGAEFGSDVEEIDALMEENDFTVWQTELFLTVDF